MSTRGGIKIDVVTPKAMDRALHELKTQDRRARAVAVLFPFLVTTILTAWLAFKPLTADMTNLMSKQFASVLIGVMGAMAASAVYATLGKPSIQRAKAATASEEKDLPEVLYRLTEQLDRINLERYLCLTAGSVIAAVGVGVAFFLDKGFVLPNNIPTGDMYPAFIMHMIPRVSVVVVLEFLAYFFLRVYSRSFEQLRFYHNELTTIELKLKALELAGASQVLGPTVLGKILVALVENDRHHNAPKVEDSNDGVTFERATELIEAAKKLKS